MPDPIKVPTEAYETAWRVACSYGELIPDEAHRLMSASGLTAHMALNRAQVETIAYRVAMVLAAAKPPAEGGISRDVDHA
jgi:hypothetical protein